MRFLSGSGLQKFFDTTQTELSGCNLVGNDEALS
jgi:hypothetical protein